jgi:hypothetical protein
LIREGTTQEYKDKEVGILGSILEVEPPHSFIKNMDFLISFNDTYTFIFIWFKCSSFHVLSHYFLIFDIFNFDALLEEIFDSNVFHTVYHILCFLHPYIDKNVCHLIYIDSFSIHSNLFPVYWLISWKAVFSNHLSYQFLFSLSQTDTFVKYNKMNY